MLSDALPKIKGVSNPRGQGSTAAQRRFHASLRLVRKVVGPGWVVEQLNDGTWYVHPLGEPIYRWSVRRWVNEP